MNRGRCMKVMIQNFSRLLLVVLFVAGMSAMNYYPIHAQESEYVTGEIKYAATGSAARGLWVEVYLGTMLKGRSLTGDDGRYYVAGLTPGSFEIVVKQNMTVLLRQGITLPAQRTSDFMLP